MSSQGPRVPHYVTSSTAPPHAVPYSKEIEGTDLIESFLIRTLKQRISVVCVTYRTLRGQIIHGIKLVLEWTVSAASAFMILDPPVGLYLT